MSNKKIGNKFEHELSELLAKYGFWCHVFAQNQDGQPSDIIAVKYGRAYLIDCKVCTYDYFSLSRIEQNQALSMDYWKQCNHESGWFAIKRKDNSVVMMSYKTLKDITKSRISKAYMDEYGISLERWLETNG